ncbi:TFIIB-type zinc ribbon-containing protein [Wohlfahrtiimonas populi]|uniref:TFIIB-type zinc ribbon-containing protein n=1 Tax=Wohlfahrtiimonas populi TaxID=1940240 RepID=UPI00098D2C59|nr:zf-TFIIB domain-containing protein [Wohlfahrtiimonas populi]
MKCPVCVDATLVMSERKGIEIDYCPQCRGIWLDRGEIDKIIERSVEEMMTDAPTAQQAAPQRAPQQSQSQPYPHHHHEDDYHYRKNKKKSFWMELFD